MKYGESIGSFAAATGVRALKTLCQTAVALIGTNAMGVTEVDWVGVVSGAALAAIVSVLTSVATGLPEIDGKYIEGGEE